MIVKKAILNIAQKDFLPGLSYVAISRAKTLRGILFEEPFHYERFRYRLSETAKTRIANRERREPEHLISQQLATCSSSPAIP
jgi:ATP-dependent DNA helicase PIF1